MMEAAVANCPLFGTLCRVSPFSEHTCAAELNGTESKKTNGS